MNLFIVCSCSSLVRAKPPYYNNHKLLVIELSESTAKTYGKPSLANHNAQLPLERREWKRLCRQSTKLLISRIHLLRRSSKSHLTVGGLWRTNVMLFGKTLWTVTCCSGRLPSFHSLHTFIYTTVFLESQTFVNSDATSCCFLGRIFAHYYVYYFAVLVDFSIYFINTAPLTRIILPYLPNWYCILAIWVVPGRYSPRWQLNCLSLVIHVFNTD